MLLSVSTPRAFASSGPADPYATVSVAESSPSDFPSAHSAPIGRSVRDDLSMPCIRKGLLTGELARGAACCVSRPHGNEQMPVYATLGLIETSRPKDPAIEKS